MSVRFDFFPSPEFIQFQGTFIEAVSLSSLFKNKFNFIIYTQRRFSEDLESLEVQTHLCQSLITSGYDSQNGKKLKSQN